MDNVKIFKNTLGQFIPNHLLKYVITSANQLFHAKNLLYRAKKYLSFKGNSQLIKTVLWRIFYL